MRENTRIKLFYDLEYTKNSVSKMQDEINMFMIGRNIMDIKFTSEGAENGHSYMVMVIYK